MEISEAVQCKNLTALLWTGDFWKATVFTLCDLGDGLSMELMALGFLGEDLVTSAMPTDGFPWEITWLP